MAIPVNALPASMTDLIPSSVAVDLIPNKPLKNPPDSTSWSAPPIAAKASETNPITLLISFDNDTKSIFDFTKELNASNPVAILFKALPAPITESIPLAVALGLYAPPNTAPNRLPATEGFSPPAAANAVVIPDNTVVNCKLSSCVHSNFW